MAGGMSGGEGDSPLRYERIIIVGGGCYGGYYVRQLHRAARAGALVAESIVVVDRDAGSGDVTILGRAAAALAVRISGKVAVERGSYPEPPVSFALDPDTETLWNRWRGYVEGREPLQAMAYFCLSVLEVHGRRAGAQKRFAVSGSVLRKIATLSTETGDPQTTARKATTNPRPITSLERAWLEAAVKALVRRAGEFAAASGAALPTITMGDLPKL